MSSARGTAGSDTIGAGTLVQHARTAGQGVSVVARSTVSSVVRGASGSGASGTVGAGALVENASTAGQSVPAVASAALLSGARQSDITSTIVTVALVAALGGTASGNAATVGIGWASQAVANVGLLGRALEASAPSVAIARVIVSAANFDVAHKLVRVLIASG